MVNDGFAYSQAKSICQTNSFCVEGRNRNGVTYVNIRENKAKGAQSTNEPATLVDSLKF